MIYIIFNDKIATAIIGRALIAGIIREWIMPFVSSH
jgi:hypothetical protein